MRRRPLWIAGAVAAVVAAVVVLVWFQPQRLLIDERVSDTLPTRTPSTDTTVAEDTAPATATTTATSDEPAELAHGSFISRDHGTEGVVRVLSVGDERIVRIEGLKTDNGPDLFVYLSPNPADGDEGAFDDGFLNLGRLKGNLGDQNYDLPIDADLAAYRSVVIWCDRFNAAFGAANLA